MPRDIAITGKDRKKKKRMEARKSMACMTQQVLASEEDCGVSE